MKVDGVQLNKKAVAIILKVMADAAEAMCCHPLVVAKFKKDAWADGQSFDLVEGYAHKRYDENNWLCDADEIRKQVDRLHPGLGARPTKEWRNK